MRSIRAAIVSLLVAGALVGPALPAGAGGGCHRSLGMEPADEHGDTIAFAEMCATPTILRVPVGENVTWINKDQTLHNVTSGWGGWAGAELFEGDHFAFTFTKPGTYPYYCSLHASMGGAVIVGSGRIDLVDADDDAVRVADTSTTQAAAPDRDGVMWLALIGVAAFGGFAVGRKARAQD